MHEYTSLCMAYVMMSGPRGASGPYHMFCQVGTPPELLHSSLPVSLRLNVKAKEESLSVGLKRKTSRNDEVEKI